VSVSGDFFVFSFYLSSLSPLPPGFYLAPLAAERSICSATNINYYFISSRVYARIRFDKYDSCVRACACSGLRQGVADEAYVINVAYYAPTPRSNAPTAAANSSSSVILSTSPGQREYPISRVLKYHHIKVITAL